MMISASSNVIGQEPLPPTGQTALEQFQQLAQDLQSGNLSAAQSIYSSLAQNAPPAATDPNTPLGQAFQKLGQNLQSGDLAGATQALNAVAGHVRMHGRHFHAVPLANSSESASPAEPDGSVESGSGRLNVTA